VITTAASTPQTWAGWVRTDGQWREVARGEDHETEWAGLIDYVSSGRHVERVVLPVGQHSRTSRSSR
jgi:hypothetical protein